MILVMVMVMVMVFAFGWNDFVGFSHDLVEYVDHLIILGGFREQLEDDLDDFFLQFLDDSNSGKHWKDHDWRLKSL